MDELSYLSRPPRRSNSSLLNDLHGLNRQFLAVVLAADDAVAGLDACTLQSLHGLDEHELERLATCPYSLFDLAFSDPGTWREVLKTQSRTAAPPRTTDEIGAFTLAALLFARQLCQHHDDMARLVLGMTEDVLRVLAVPDLPTLTACAFSGQPPLMARLAAHPHFWSDIVDFVRNGTRERQLAAHTLGMQHSAARFSK